MPTLDYEPPEPRNPAVGRVVWQSLAGMAIGLVVVGLAMWALESMFAGIRKGRPPAPPASQPTSAPAPEDSRHVTATAVFRRGAPPPAGRAADVLALAGIPAARERDAAARCGGR